MNKFLPGQTVYHKATIKRCVVIRDNGNGTIKVRNQDDKELDYFPEELEPKQKTIVHRKKRYLY